MKSKTNILFSLLLCGTFATAQNLKLDILPPSVTLGQDSAIVSMKMTLECSPDGHQKPYPSHPCPHRRNPHCRITSNSAQRRTCTSAIPPHPGAQQTKRQSECNSRIYRYPPDRQRSDYPLPRFPPGSRLDTVRHTEPQEGSHQRQRRESTKRKYPHSGQSNPYSNSNR